ncbi:MAG: hypothetical protein K0S93_186 [Nitrososphaeraceae archaeon]|jgi:hypothetical protein|nr:hypothetical protein [Nitrososphaeraceae archaeon]
MKPIAAMFCSILIMLMMMTATTTMINYLEGDILPDTSPWSFISWNFIMEVLK